MEAEIERRVEIDEEVLSWIKSVDGRETILTVFDAGKFSNGFVFRKLIRSVLENSRSMRFRIGGNSFRLAGAVIDSLIKRNGQDAERFEFFLGSKDLPDCLSRVKDKFESLGIKCYDVSKLGIVAESDFGRYVDQYDIRGCDAGYSEDSRTVTVYYDRNRFDSHPGVPTVLKDGDGTILRRNDPPNGLKGSLSTLYLRGERSGFISHGRFEPFNDADKGAWAIGDVVMVKGFGDISPSTHVLVPLEMMNIKESCEKLFADVGVDTRRLVGPILLGRQGKVAFADGKSDEGGEQ